MQSPLANSLGFLRRRGPDSWHYKQLGDGQVELIQARLAIVDPNGRSDQPFSEPRHQLTVVFNGEIYNFQQVRNELAGHEFRTQSDTEVLLAAFARWGVAGLQRLRGMFACAIIDERSRRVFLVRDPVGKKPLYVAHWPGGVYFGSTLLALASCETHAPAIRKEVHLDFMRRGYVSPTTAILEGARPIAPGEVLELDWEGRILATHDCSPALEPTPEVTLEEAHQRLMELLDQSVSRRLHNNPHPVSLISGGTDSTIICSRMRHMGIGSGITLGALVPLGLDEKYARYAAWRIGMPLEVVKLGIRELEHDVAWALDLQDEPLGMMSFFPLALLLRASKKYGKILLTGDGGDEVFLGYGEPRSWTDPKLGVDDSTVEDRQVIVGLQAPSWMSPWGRHTIGNTLLGHMLAKVDRASAEQGIEIRCPLLDLDLMTFARSLSPELLFEGGRPKGLLASALANWPRWFVRRKKLGFPYHFRWAWGLRRFAGLREMIADNVVELFGASVPASLRRRARDWHSWDIFRNFGAAWNILAWSRFEDRLKRANAAASSASDPHFLGNGQRIEVSGPSIK